MTQYCWSQAFVGNGRFRLGAPLFMIRRVSPSPLRPSSGRHATDAAAVVAVDRVDGFVTPTRERKHEETAGVGRSISRSPTSVLVALGRGSSSAAAVCPVVAPPPNRKYKTEMCTNLMRHGYCRFGENCHYAHSEAERHSTSVEDLMRDDSLLYPCSILVSTGFCPYGHRCKNLHDPRVTANDDGNTIVLEHCVKAKRHGFTIPDRLYHSQLSSVRQTNPLVAPYIWENCRPSRSTGESSEWTDTYSLVCNDTVPPGIANDFVKPGRTEGGGPTYSDVVSKSNRQVVLDELQRLCIVMQMREKSDAHLDFTYVPNDCINDQPCMVLQTRYFRLLDLPGRGHGAAVSVGDVALEVPPEVYQTGKSSNSDAFVCAHEVAFESKGKRSCNLSVWFDAKVTTCSTTKAKKMSKKKDPWHAQDGTGGAGGLFCMPINREFERTFPTHVPPYIFMQPVDDLTAGHDIVKAILRHRAAAILLARGFCFNLLPSPMGQLQEDFARMKDDLERWTWPKTCDVDHFSNAAERRNMAEYAPGAAATPEDVQENAVVSAIWKSFVTNLDAPDGSAAAAAPEKRFRVFRSIATKTTQARASSEPSLPRLDPFLAEPLKPFSCLSRPEATWKELLLGEGGGEEGRPWKRAIESHLANPKRFC